MRPAGELHLAILKAAREITGPDKGATLRELAAKACVGYKAARYVVGNMRRCGALEVRELIRVDYVNRPVAQYAIPDSTKPKPGDNVGALTAAMAAWTRQT